MVKASQKCHTYIISSARAYTDVSTNTTDFINQRRRWLNGAFGATLSSRSNGCPVAEIGPQYLSSLLAARSDYPQYLNHLARVVSLSGFLLTTSIINEVTGDPPLDASDEGFPPGLATLVLNATIRVLYVAPCIPSLSCPEKLSNELRCRLCLSFFLFAVAQIYLLMNLIYLTKRLIDFRQNSGSKYAFINEYFTDVGQITVLATAISQFGLHIGAGVLALDLWHPLTSSAQCLFIFSSYTNILTSTLSATFMICRGGQKNSWRAALAARPKAPAQATTQPARNPGSGL